MMAAQEQIKLASSRKHWIDGSAPAALIVMATKRGLQP